MFCLLTLRVDITSRLFHSRAACSPRCTRSAASLIDANPGNNGLRRAADVHPVQPCDGSDTNDGGATGALVSANETFTPSLFSLESCRLCRRSPFPPRQGDGREAANLRSHVRRTSVVGASKWKPSVGVNHLRNRIHKMLSGWLSHCFLSGNVTSLSCVV